MAKETNSFFGNLSRFSTRERVTKYLAKWPLFAVCLVICVGAGLLYIRNTVPKYIATTNFLIKGADRSDDLIEAAMNGKRQINLNNEMLLISASNLMERTVAKNGFNTRYFIVGRLLTVEIYKDAPFLLVANDIKTADLSYNIHISDLSEKGGSITDESDENQTATFLWNQPFNFKGQRFTLVPKDPKSIVNGEYIVQWQPVAATAGEFSANLAVKAYDAKTSVIQISLKAGNLQQGKDVLDALFREFNLTDVEERNKLSDSTVSFITDRLVAITNELKGVEGKLENYQGSRELVDIKGQSTQSLTNSSDVAKTIKDINIQQGVTSMIMEYFANPANSGKLVPSSLGLNDATLTSLITRYNELQLKREREAPLVAPNSTVMQDLNTQISSLRSSILESLNNITKNLRLQESSFQQQNSQYRSFLSSIPHNERMLQEIKRKQTITEGLYLYLFQKREEAAISRTATNVARYVQIDPATGYGPVEPNKTNILLASVLLALMIAFGGIYVYDMLNDKITSKEDIAQRTRLPLMGQISHIPKKQKQVLSVLDRSIVGEQFRVLRTNLAFALKEKGNKTVLVTSSVSGEGKSFVSLNLAAVFAMPGKKVALLEFDIRQPVIASNLNLKVEEGLSSYLRGEVTSIADIVHVHTEISGLHIYPAGPIPDNPADLLLTENMNHLLNELKSIYDFIIIDSPPAGLVSDTFILGTYSDLVLYVIRSQKTSRKELDFISDTVTEGSLNNVNLVFNDIRQQDSYGYQYGKGYYHSSKDGARKKGRTPSTV